jgi:hypothetical protein
LGAGKDIEARRSGWHWRAQIQLENLPQFPQSEALLQSIKTVQV